MRVRPWVGALIGLVGGTVYGLLGRGYPWLLALLLGAAIGALIFSILRSAALLRGGHGGPGPGPQP